MFIIVLKFIGRREEATTHMADHRRWIAEGRSDGVFLLIGGLSSGSGGLILAHGEDRRDIEERVALDPFVAEGIVEAEIHEFAPSLADERLAFLVQTA